jgi:histidinol-phosphate aminotransferase
MSEPAREPAADWVKRLTRPDIWAMHPYSSARTEGTQDATVFLDANENPYPPYPATDAEAGLNRYPEPQPRALVERFAQLYGVAPEQVFLSRGADEAIDLLVRAFCAAGKDGVVTTPPSFVMYETAARIQNAHLHEVPLIRDVTFRLDVAGLLRTVRQRPGTKLVFVCSPNNPSGNLMGRGEILRLATELAGRALVVVDELYVDYSGAPSLAGELAEHDNLVVLRSLSKEYSLAGERCGVTLAHPEVVSVLRRIMAPYPLPRTVIRAVAAAISPDGIAHGRKNIARVLAERERVAAALAASPVIGHVYPSDANFLLARVVDGPGLVAALAARGVKIRDRGGVVPGAVRISIGTPEENDALLAGLAAFEATR